MDPFTNLSAMLGAVLGIIGEAIAALLLPIQSLIVTPLLQLLGLFAQ